MRRGLEWVRPVSGAAIVAVLLWQVGVAPLLAAVARLDAGSLALACSVAAMSTVCSAWRWVLVARGLGVALPVRSAVAACYRSQFLNLALPGGVLGDVHRGVRHGRDVSEVGKGVRSVVWERSAGQVVQMTVAIPVLLLAPSPLGAWLPAAGVALLAGALAAVVATALLVRVGRIGAPALLRTWRAALTELREGVLGPRTWPGVVGASAVAVAGHVGVFVIAARLAGSSATTLRLLPLAMFVLLAMTLPLNIGGWGAREGASAWAFGAAGLGAAQGFAVAVVYGVLVLAAALPGAVVLLGAWSRAGAGRHA